MRGASKSVQVLDLNGCILNSVNLNVWLSHAHDLRVLDLSCLNSAMSSDLSSQPPESLSLKALVLPQSVVHLHLQGERTNLDLGFAMSYQSLCR